MNEIERKTVNITTIAEEANVSIKTVSNYINDTATFPMSEKTKDVVRETMRKHNFRLNSSGSMMRSGKVATKKAVFIFGGHPELHPARVHTIPEISSLLIAIAEMMDRYDLSLTVRHVPLNTSWQHAVIDAEIVIAYGSPREYLEDICERRNIPLILIANMMPPASVPQRLDAIYWPRENIPALSLEYLASKGITSTCYLSTWNVTRGCGTPWNTPADLAISNYEAAIGRDGSGLVIVETSPVSPVPEAEIKNGYITVMNHREKLLTVQGIIAENDYIAIGAAQALLELGKKVGHDIKLIGCGNYTDASFFSPSITTVTFDMDKCLAALGELVEQRIVYNEREKKTIAIPLRLITRESA